MSRTPLVERLHQPSDSENNMSDTGKQTSSGKKTRTSKKRRVSDGENISDSISAMRNELADLIDDRFKTLSEEFKENNVEQIKTLQFMTSKYDELKEKFDIMEAQRKEDKIYIKELEDKVESLQKNNCSTTVELRNIPRKTGETKRDLTELTLKLGNALNLDIQKSELHDIHRVNSQSKSTIIPPILVKFTTALRKEEFIRTIKKLSKDRSHELANIQAKLDLPPTPIYVSEHMTAKTRRLFFLARDFSKSYNYSFCWCSRGRIFVREKEGAPQLLVKNEAHLEDLKKQQELNRTKK